MREGWLGWSVAWGRLPCVREGWLGWSVAWGRLPCVREGWVPVIPQTYEPATRALNSVINPSHTGR